MKEDTFTTTTLRERTNRHNSQFPQPLVSVCESSTSC